MFKKVKEILNNKTIKNSLWIIGERIFQAIISLFLTMVTSRYLGPSNYGILNYGATFVSLFLVIMKLGLDNIIVNELINDRNNEGKLLGTSIIMRLASGIVSIIVMTILVFILQSNSKLIIITTILQSIILLFQSVNILDYWFQSHLNSKYVSIIKGISYILVTLYKIYLLISKKNIIWFATSTIFDSLIIAVLLIVFYRKEKKQKLKFDKQLVKKLLKKSYHFIISGIMVIIYTQIDKIMIGSMINQEQLGYYSAALMVCSIWTFVPEAILTSFRPAVFESKKNNNNYLPKLKQLYAIIFWTCIAFSAFITLFAKYIIIIIFGNGYLPSIKALRILIWYVPLSQLGSARSVWIVSENKNKYIKKIMLWGVIINISLNYFLIPILGIYGAIIATIITEFTTCFISPLFYKETRIHTKYLINGLLFRFKNN